MEWNKGGSLTLSLHNLRAQLPARDGGDATVDILVWLRRRMCTPSVGWLVSAQRGLLSPSLSFDDHDPNWVKVDTPQQGCPKRFITDFVRPKKIVKSAAYMLKTVNFAVMISYPSQDINIQSGEEIHSCVSHTACHLAAKSSTW